MNRSWTFGQKLGAGFLVMVAFSVLIGVVAIYALRSAVESKDRIIEIEAQRLLDAERLRAESERSLAAGRGYLLTGEPAFLEDLQRARVTYGETIGRLRAGGSGAAESVRIVEAIDRARSEHTQAVDRAVSRRREGAPIEEIVKTFDEDLLPKREALEEHIAAFVAAQEREMNEAKRLSNEAADSAIKLVVAIAVAIVGFAIAVAYALGRALSRQIGAAVQHVQSSSSELQASANQQATGARQQASAMAEISTTISELLVTSREIADSARRVAQIAEDTANAARSGDLTVQRANESVTGIRKQVDVIVGHMLDLGRKSQQIGTILELINELAEQTNILAINATIEAAGAGEAGRRFGVVAEEIRKLADRVAGSTKEIRGLIEEIRSAVNTTVMSTEGGSKAVDAGTRQFAEVAISFKQIGGLVGTTTEAAREIQLSTKQQASAVEQVNLAIANVAQATRETEASSSQTLQTASQLTGLSRDLARLVRAEA